MAYRHFWANQEIWAYRNLKILLCPSIILLILTCQRRSPYNNLRIIFPDNISPNMSDSQVNHLWSNRSNSFTKRSEIVCDSVWFIWTVHSHTELFSAVSHIEIVSGCFIKQNKKSIGWDGYLPIQTHFWTQNLAVTSIFCQRWIFIAHAACKRLNCRWRQFISHIHNST